MSTIRFAVASVSWANAPIGMIPGVVDEHVERAEAVLDLVEERGEAGAVGHVERQADGAGAELLGSALGERGIDVADRDSGTLGDQRRRGGATDPPGAAGDCNDIARERAWGFRHEAVLPEKR